MKVILLWRNQLLHLCSGNEGSGSKPIPPHRCAKGFSKACLGMHSHRDRYCRRFYDRQYLPMHSCAQSLDLSISGSCIDVNALFLANAGLDMFQDAFIYVLPVRMLYQLQVPRRQKIALMLVFAVGGFVVITGMVRLNYLKAAQNTPDPSCKQLRSKALENFI